MSHSFDDGNSCIRLYNNDGKHVASILPCDYTDGKLNCDIVLPNGKVLYCGINEQLLQAFIGLFGIQEIN